MRAFFHRDQHLHAPKQFMRAGRLADPADLPSRTDALLAALQHEGLPVTQPADYGTAPALTVHTPEYLEFLATAFQRWQALPDAGPEVLPNTFPYWNARPDAPRRPPCPSQALIAHVGYYLGDLAVPVGPDTWRSALVSTHSAAAATDAVLSGDPAAYALCRPSGHHARADRASGFCYLNSAAIAAERLRAKYARVAVLDVDAHHGDGTQAIFYHRPDILTVSIHADPASYYPFFTGYTHERGYGPGEGANLNLPLAPGDGDDALDAAMKRAVDAVAAFAPDALVVALGFDSHAQDPIGVLKVSTSGFSAVGAHVRGFALPTVVVQEGGYQVSVIGDCLRAFLQGARHFT